MTALNQVNGYVRRLEQRLRLFAAARGAAIIAAAALILTVVLVWIANRYEFASQVVLPFRILLFLLLAAAVSIALALPLLRLNRRSITRLAERRIPDFEQRLLTAIEQRDPSNPFNELIAEDAMRVAAQHPAEELSAPWMLVTCGASAFIAAGILVWLIASGPGYWGYGSGLLWTGRGSPDKRPLYAVTVQPGNKTVRRKSDQAVTAQLLNFSANQVVLHARYHGATRWESAPMQPKQDGAGYQFMFAGLSDSVEYFVQADAAQSKHYILKVKDLPAVKRVRVTVHFPAGLHLQDVSQDPGGDIRAVTGSNADVSVLTDRPLERGELVLEDGRKIALTHGSGNWLTARLPVAKDGSYHVAAIDDGDTVRISDDYFIEAKQDEPPSVRILRPGRDPHVSPIEEVPVTVEASDDFGLEGLNLHYSINGGPEQVVPLLKAKEPKEADGKTTLYLEKYKLQPGDLISMYASARDANTTSRSDIVFAQAEPFDLKFSQSQQAGGMGGMGMGGQDGDISERQKQIIAATWNELRGSNETRATLQEHARFLSELQGKLGEQAKTLAERMGNRELSSPGSEFETFSKMMTQASTEMADAAGQLKPGKWHDALPPEQRALQSVMRAEALFRNIQVAFGQSGGGAGGSGAQRDLARMFDLELDTSKNQYETQQNTSQAQSDQQKAIDDAFERLQMLARRQQELAAQNNQQQPMEQRWQEEQLRRQAEELRHQMEQLAKNSQGRQQSGSQQSGQGGSASSSGQQRQAQGASGSSGAQNQELSRAMKQSLDSLRQAEQEMRNAVSNHDASAQQRAAARLAEAQELLNNALHQQANTSVGDMADKAQQLANAQRELANKLKQMYGQPGLREQPGEGLSTLPGEPGQMPQMNDPTTPGYYGYRRRFWQQELEPRRQPTPEERSLAGEKEKLAQQLQQLQRQMQQQQQNLAGTQPDASSKMRRALSNAEEKELALRMQKNAEWMRQGFGDRNLEMEDSVTAGLDQLARDLRDTERALAQGQQGRGTTDQKAEQALAQVRGLRQMLEEAQRARQQGQGQSSQGSGQQQSGQQPGQQSGAGQQGGQEAQGGQYSPWGSLGNPGIDRRGLNNAITDLYAFRRNIDPRDRALYNYVDGTLGYLRDLNANPAVLDSAISQDAVSSLERLEMELSRRVGQPQSEGARITPPESSPEKYRQAVAEYFKKLSQPK
jgi:hypothetical protein